MRLNKFVRRAIASPSALFRLYGYSEPKFVSKQTAENIEVTVPTAARKTQILELASRDAKKAAQFAKDPQNTKPMDRVSPNEI